MASASRVSKKETKRPLNKKNDRFAETKRLWQKRAVDYWVAKSICAYVEHHGVVYSATIEGILIELCEMLDGQVKPTLLEKYRHGIEMGTERNMFRFETDNKDDPCCWGLWISNSPDHSLPQKPSRTFLILATG